MTGRLRPRLRAAGIVAATVLVAAAATAPLAVALESTDPTTETADVTPEPTGSPTLEDPTVAPTEDLEDDATGTVENGVGDLEDAVSSLTEEPSPEPSNEPDDPSDLSDDDDSEQDTDDGGGPTTEPEDEPATDREDSASSGDGSRQDSTGSSGAPDATSRFADLRDLSKPRFFADVSARSPGERSTHDVIDRMVAAGLDLAGAARILAPFPVIGRATYSGDWHAPRDGGLRLHEGTDIFAPLGTPVAASFDGTIGRMWVGANRGGNALTVRTADSTYAYYAHLAGFATDVRIGTPVRAGDIIGYVGATGNAERTPPHLHFELHPGGGPPVPPVPHLDQWLSEARTELLLHEPPSGQLTGALASPSFQPVALPRVAPPGGEPSDVAASGPGPRRTASLTGTSPTGLAAAPVDGSDAATPLLALLAVCAWFLLVRRQRAARGADPVPGRQP